MKANDRALLLHDFEAARAHLGFVVRLKTSCWQQLPLLWCGLAHHDLSLARDMGRQGLAMAASLDDGVEPHALTF